MCDGQSRSSLHGASDAQEQVTQRGGAQNWIGIQRLLRFPLMEQQFGAFLIKADAVASALWRRRVRAPEYFGLL
jgi:hypothetical protein